jgi:hypothetical protein
VDGSALSRRRMPWIRARRSQLCRSRRVPSPGRAAVATRSLAKLCLQSLPCVNRAVVALTIKPEAARNSPARWRRSFRQAPSLRGASPKVAVHLKDRFGLGLMGLTGASWRRGFFSFSGGLVFPPAPSLRAVERNRTGVTVASPYGGCRGRIPKDGKPHTCKLVRVDHALRRGAHAARKVRMRTVIC